MHYFAGVDVILLLRKLNLYFCYYFLIVSVPDLYGCGQLSIIFGRVSCLFFDSVVRQFKSLQGCSGFSFRDVDLFEGGGLHFTLHII